MRGVIKKYSGVLGVFLLALMGLIVVASGFSGVTNTFSYYSSLDPVLQIYFCEVGCIGSVLMGYCLLSYVAHKWRLGKTYKILAGIVAAAFFVTCFFPNDRDAYTMHDYGSWVMAAAALALAAHLLFRLWRVYGFGMRVVNTVVFGVMLMVAMVIFVNYGLFRSLVLFFEGGFVVGLFVLVLFLIFDTPRMAKKRGKKPAARGRGF